MKEFRGPLPLDDRDFAEIRARVMEKIERRPRVRFAIPAFALAAAALLVFVLVPRHNAPPRPGVGAGVPARSAAGEDARRHTETAVAVPQPIQVAEKAAPTRRTPKAASAPPSDQEITMEIHTADPDVRIIWIGSR